MFPSQPRHCRGRAAAAVVVEVVADAAAVDVTAVGAALGAEVATAIASFDVESPAPDPVARSVSTAGSQRGLLLHPSPPEHSLAC